MTTFFCLRHGETDWNRDKRIQGQTDTELAESGRDMAEQWGKSLADNHFDRILCSPLQRAMETAEIINKHLGGLPMDTDSRLMEQNWGQWTTKTKKDLKEIDKQLRKQENKGFGFRPPAGESRDEVLMRACDAFMEYTEAHPDTRVLVVTHNGVLQCLTYALSGLEFLPGEPCPIKPYRIHRVECFDNEIALGDINMEL
jgi:probable phosphoglycerate mutase